MADIFREYLPVIIVCAIIGAFTLVGIMAFVAMKKQKEDMTDRERHMSDREIVTRLLRYAKPYWKNFIAHRISTIERMDKILFIDEGKLVAVGSHAELYENCPDYQKMVDLQKLEEEGGAHNG